MTSPKTGLQTDAAMAILAPNVSIRGLAIEFKEEKTQAWRAAEERWQAWQQGQE